jgi:phosphoglycolate phosphatase
MMIERITANFRGAPHARVALFDFDGTLSIIRSGWVNVMVPMMVEFLLDLKTGESEESLTDLVNEFVGRLTGKQTMYQMIELANEIEKRGGEPKDPLEYKRIYLERLSHKIGDRIEALRRGEASPEQYLVPGSRRMLECLKERGLKMYLASGTDEVFMKQEARLLDVDRYFDGGCYGALDDYKSFSKAILIQRIISSSEATGDQLLGFGDGYVEIENVKHVGGVAVGVATDEPECLQVEPWKRKRLAGVGADLIIPNFLDYRELVDVLLTEVES